MFVVVCDYNDEERSRIAETLERIECVNFVETYNNPENLLESMNGNRFDIIFLEINLPTMNGIETAKAIRDIDPDVHIVFITGIESFCLDAFSVYATDYILKPVNFDRLEKTVRRIKEKTRHCNEKIVDIKTQNVVYRVKESDIVLIEKVMNRCMVYTEKFTFDVLSPLKYFEDILDESKFIRSHAGYLVNRDRISKIEVNGNLSYTLHFYNINKTALVSRGKKNKLFKGISNTKILVNS
ncbi:MAG: LytTR family DNA-binding domain-containing protein [Clostridia bacterium]|nr:LytTR family DNA-binding domain-containing protein [Clostridia bacterium]